MSQQPAIPPGTNPALTYQAYYVPSLFTPWARELLLHAQPRRGEHVLDVACGTGIVARSVAPLVGAEGTVDALDISPAMLEVARSLPAPEGATIRWHEGSATGLPFPDGTFDLVLCQQGLQFFPDRQTALHEMRRVLRSDGRVALSVWRSLQVHPVYKALYAAIAARVDTTMEALAVPFSIGDADQLRRLFEEAGFQWIDVRPRELTISFPQPERFAALTVQVSAAVIPAFVQMDPATRADLVEGLGGEMMETLRPYIVEESLVIPLRANIAVAQA